MDEQNEIMYMYHIFIFHASIEWHLGYFRFLDTVNGTAMNMDEQVSLQYDIESLDMWPGVELLGNMVVLFLVEKPPRLQNDYPGMHLP